MKIALQNQSGEKLKDLAVSEVFAKEVSDKSVTLYIQYLRNSMRSPVADTKDRSEVSGGGRKPWKQKGTGSARVGSTRSPLWVGGGVTFGPSSNQNFHTRINKNEKKRVIAGLIGQMIKDKKVIIVDDFKFEKPNTKAALQIVENLKVEGKISLIFDIEDIAAEKSFRNIPGVNILYLNKLNTITLFSSDYLITKESVFKKIEEMYSKSANK